MSTRYLLVWSSCRVSILVLEGISGHEGGSELEGRPALRNLLSPEPGAMIQPSFYND